MIGLSDIVTLCVIVVVLAVVALAVAVSWANPVVDVADETTTARSADEVRAVVAGALADLRGVQVRMDLPGTWTVSYRHHPRYAVLLAILSLPVGLLVLLFVRETLLLTISVTGDSGSTRILVVGHAHKKLAESLGERIQPLSESPALRA
ncbi:hypothetical protein ACVW00_001802 [Marmoricola sp. URHA0025 HA25]